MAARACVVRASERHLRARVELNTVPSLLEKHANGSLHDAFDHLAFERVLGAATVVEIPPRLEAESVRPCYHARRVGKELSIPHGSAIGCPMEGVVFSKAFIPTSIQAPVAVSEVEQ